MIPVQRLNHAVLFVSNLEKSVYGADPEGNEFEMEGRPPGRPYNVLEDGMKRVSSGPL